MSNYLTTAIVPVISLAILSWLASAVRKNAKHSATGFVVQYGLPCKIIAIISGVITAFFVLTYFVVESNDRPAVLVLNLLFGLITVPLTLMVFRTRIEVEPDCMIVRSPWRRTRKIPFTDIESVEFSKRKRRHEIRTGHNGNLYLHALLSGVPDLIEEVDRHRSQ